MQNLFDTDNLNEKSYPLAERLRNLNGDWTPTQLEIASVKKN